MSCGGCFSGLQSFFQAPRIPLKEIFESHDGEALQRWLPKENTPQCKQLVECLRQSCLEGDVNRLDSNGFTALQCAVRCNDVELVEELISAGATLKTSGETLLTTAMSSHLPNSTMIKTIEKAVAEEEAYEDSLDIDWFRQVPLFRQLPASTLPFLVAAVEQCVFEKGHTVMAQGEEANKLFVIRTGEAEVFAKNAQGENFKVTSFYSKGFFGLTALLQDERQYSVIAATHLEVLILSRADCDKFELRQKMNALRRPAVMKCGKARNKVHKEDDLQEKPDHVVALILKAMRENKKLGSVLAKASEEALLEITKHAMHVDLQPGEVAIQEGDAIAHFFYVVEQGHLQSNSIPEIRFGPGDCFGEQALLYSTPRVMTVTAQTPTRLWAIDRHDLNHVTGKHDQERRDRFSAYLAQVEMLQSLQPEELVSIADCLYELRIKKNSYVYKQGDPAENLYLLINGAVENDRNGVINGQFSINSDKKELQIFGAPSLIDDRPHLSSLKCTSDVCTLLTLNRDVFKKSQAIVETRNHAQMQAPINLLRSESVQKNTTSSSGRYNYKRQDFQFLKKLGHGAFGMVSLQRHVPSGVTFAMKSLSKGFIVEQGQERCVRNEKIIMRVLSSPFLIRFAASFSEPGSQCIELVMEAAYGGEVNELYHKFNLFGQMVHARFYVACAARGLAYLHERHIIYRDMKAENLLLDARGYCKIADFGLSKFCLGRAYTFCGTPAYMAPELMGSEGHTLAIDWWSLGALLFELMTGYPPFDGNEPLEILEAASKGIDNVRFPSEGKWASMVRDLCQVDPEQRLPVGPGGMEMFEAHPWFTADKPAWSWKVFDKRAMKAPYKPEPNRGVFQQEDDGGPPEITFVRGVSEWDLDMHDTMGPAPEEFSELNRQISPD